MLQPVISPGYKVHTYASSNSIFDGLVINLLSILCILIEILSRVHAKGQKRRNDFRCGTPVGRFPSDGS